MWGEEMNGNDFKNRSGHMNNNVRSGRQQENRSEVRQAQVNVQQPQQNRQLKNDGYRRDGQGYKTYNRDNRDNRDNREGGFNKDSSFRPYNSQGSSTRRIKTEETIDDIRADLARIEKEIELEIKQIATLRLGV